MEYQGIIITGTRGAGKSTVARELCAKHGAFRRVQAITTRGPREGDDQGEYHYVTEEDFNKLVQDKALLVSAQYRDKRYGITSEAFRQVAAGGNIPLLILTPQCIEGLKTHQDPSENDERPRFFTVFIDAPDEILDTRLMGRGEAVNNATVEQRTKDRQCLDLSLYRLTHEDTENTACLLLSLWEYRSTGGMLSKRIIRLMLECGMLLKDASPEKITGAAYDLRLGDEYYYGGRIKTLTDKDPFIPIEPYDYAIVTSKEITDLPKDVTARFDLSVSLFCQGIILSNGPQVDPGFKGTLFCLLFNTSNAPVFLKRGQHYATIEFHKLMEPTDPYRGKYQGEEKIIHYLPSNTMQGAINELKKELEEIRGESRTLQSIFFGVISLILAIIAILLVIR